MVYTESDIEFLKSELYKYENADRLEHSLSVEKCISDICRTQNVSDNECFKMRIAGLLHDITRQRDTDEQRELFRRLGLELTENDELSPSTLHARTGAYLAQRLYPSLVDDDIRDMIYCHCTGKAKMSLGEKIVFLADYIEPKRKHDACIRLRNYYFFENNEKNVSYRLDRAVFLAYDLTVRNLTEKKAFIHPDTLIGMEYMKCELKKYEMQERKIYGENK